MSKNSIIKLVLPGFLVSAGLLSAFLFPASSGRAVSSSSAGTELGATVIEYIRLALDTNTVTLRDGDEAVVAPSVSGTLATGNLNVAVTTNTSKGFSLGIYTQDETTAMTNPSVSATIPSVSGATGYDASTGISSLATDTWGFRKKTGESGGTPTYGNWFGVGADETHGTVIENSNSSSSEYCATLSYPLENSGCSASTYAEHTLNFGANLTSALPAGTYANNIVVSAVAKSEGTTYTINFNANGGSGQMGTKSIVAGSTFTMPANTLITNEYPFLGYSFDANAKTATYEPGDIVTVNDFLSAATSAGQDIDNGLTLYLIWDIPVSYLQTFGSCATIPEGETGTLTDSRDDQEYTVYRFPSTNSAPVGLNDYCIMTKDLSLGYVTGGSITKDSDLILTTDDSAATTTITARTGTSDWSTANDDSNRQYINGTGGTYDSHSYYSYGAAQAVCPKGWRLPTRGEYEYIVTFMGGNNETGLNTIRNTPYNFIYGGVFDSSGWSYVGSLGRYWSSDQQSSVGGYLLFFTPNSTTVGTLTTTSSGKYASNSVRCIAEAVEGAMQNFDTSSLAIGETARLADERDGSVYTVKKFGSGNDTEVWMTQNLVLGYDKGYTLTKDDTNIPDNTTYYLPPAGKRGSVTSSSTVTTTNTATFDTSTSNVSEAHVQYRAAGQAGDQSSTGTLFQNTGYYNYPAATLGYSYYNDGLSSGNSPRDICPAGWQLPRGSSTSTYSFYWLDTTLGGTGANRTDTTTRDKFLNDASFGYSGYYYSYQLYSVGSHGYWWSSTLNSSTYAYFMYLHSAGNVYPQGYSDKYRGIPIRCVAK